MLNIILKEIMQIIKIRMTLTFDLNAESTLRLTSYNCQGIKNKLPLIHELCNDNDILVLQETWLLPFETNSLKSVHNDYESFSQSSVNIHNSLLVGRPYGGLSILWRSSLSHMCKLIPLDDDRLMGMIITVNCLKYFF